MWGFAKHRDVDALRKELAAVRREMETSRREVVALRTEFAERGETSKDLDARSHRGPVDRAVPLLMLATLALTSWTYWQGRQIANR